MKCMYVACVSNLSSCSDAVFKSAFLFFTFVRPNHVETVRFSLHETLCPARCLYSERELSIYFCKFLSFFLTLFPQFSLTKLPRCHFQDFPVSYFLLAERRYSSVFFRAWYFWLYEERKKKKTDNEEHIAEMFLIATKWFTHWAFGAA